MPRQGTLKGELPHKQAVRKWLARLAALLRSALPRNMWCNARPLGVLAAMTKGLLILCALPTDAGKSSQALYVKQIHSLVRHMAEDAQELFTFYESNQGLNVPKLCRGSKWVEWLPRGHMADLLVPSALQELYGAMQHMDHALQTISQHQQDLNAPGSELLRRLANTHLKVRGLLNNVETLLRAQGVVPIHITLPRKPAVTKVFQQKLEGCRVLWSYSHFMRKLNTSLEAKGLLDLRKPRRQRRGSRRDPRASKWVRHS